MNRISGINLEVKYLSPQRRFPAVDLYQQNDGHTCTCSVAVSVQKDSIPKRDATVK